MTPFRGVLAVAVIGSVLAGLGAHYRTDVIEAARMIVTGEPMPRYERRPLGDIIADDDTLLSEDPYLPVAYGRLPVMLDFFMLKRIAEAHPEWGESMLERIRGAEFDYIVLLWDLDPSSRWYTEMPFATTFAHAVEQHYEYDRSVRDYNLYTPRLSGTQIEHNEDGEQLPPE
jgi:hypothetical protein